jgi:hypothetical protein
VAGNANRPVNGTINEQGWRNNVLGGQTRWLAGFAVHPDVIAVATSTSLNKKAAYSNWEPASRFAPQQQRAAGNLVAETGFIGTPPEVTQYLPGLRVFTADRVGDRGYDRGDYSWQKYSHL